MDRHVTHTEFHCSHCSQLNLSMDSELAETIKGMAKYNFFHEACLNCDETSSRGFSALCSFCRHLRVRHLLICVPEKHPGIFNGVIRIPSTLSIALQPHHTESTQCEFCQFLVSCGDNFLNITRPAGSTNRSQAWNLTIQQRGVAMIYFPTGKARFFADPHGEERERVRAFIDWDWLRDWMQASSQDNPWTPKRFSLQQEVHDVRVIDVQESCVIRLPVGRNYGILSYVWGLKSPESQLRSMKCNIDLLGASGALKKAKLPRTISDAIKVCQELGIQYLWVDSLCIIQDESPKELLQQLDQMANIYHGAMLTLVAATGDNATHGLAGVSHARDTKQQFFKFDDRFTLVGTVPSLLTCFRKSTWATRGWTFQEYVASKRLLFFTDHGLYLKGCFGIPNEVPQAEGPAESGYFHEDTLDLQLIEEYTTRSLTYASDILRALAGILGTLYDDRLSFGMPLDEFDSAILWMPTEYNCQPRKSAHGDVFPTWSWASSSCPVRFPRRDRLPFSLAYWGQVIADKTDKQGSLSWSTIPPVHRKYIMEPSNCVSAALAWLNGCSHTDVPQDLFIDCDAHKFSLRIWYRWNKFYSSYWHDIFRGYEKRELFKEIFETSIIHANCLLVYTQQAYFAVDWRNQESLSSDINKGYKPALIRTRDNGIAGTIELTDYAVQRLQKSDRMQAQFIAVSIDGGPVGLEDMILTPYIEKHFSHLSISEFYGCPCSVGSQDAVGSEHLLECPKHAKFSSPEPIQSTYASPYNVLAHKDHEQACSHFLPQLGYLDAEGMLINDWRHPPFLWVMLVALSEHRGKDARVYQRLGIGKVFLRRWVEASPLFETLVLE